MKSKLLLVAILFSVITNAQKLTFDQVLKINLRNTGPILQKGQIKGYYFFYETDKIDRKTNAYSLNILDENLNKVKEIKMEESKDISLLEAAFNGNALSFLFFNPKEKIFETRIYGVDGKLKFTYTRVIDKKTEGLVSSYLNNQTKSDVYQNQRVFSVDNKGFISIIPIKQGKINTYEVEYNSSEENKQWIYSPSEEEDRFIVPTFLATTDSLIILQIAKKHKLLSGKITTSVLGINFQTKQKAFEIEDARDNYIFTPEYCTKLNKTGQIMLMGSYFDKEDNILKDFSLGVGIYTIDSKGNILSKTYNSWKDDMSNYLTINKKGKIEDIGYLFFHQMIQASNGNLFVVGEGYKRTADALGIGLNVLRSAGGGIYGGGVGNTKISITDLVILEFGPDFKVKSALTQPKNHSSIHTEYADLNSQHTLALWIKSFGGFDYEFTTYDKDVNSFSVCYTDYEKTDEYKGKTFSILKYNGSKFKNDKIPLSSKATYLKVFPAKPGYVVLFEYFKKEKKIDLRIEKIG